jgi:hypothetical protein
MVEERKWSKLAIWSVVLFILSILVFIFWLKIIEIGMVWVIYLSGLLLTLSYSSSAISYKHITKENLKGRCLIYPLWLILLLAIIFCFYLYQNMQ